ncbi:MAG TPA: hypothetical protein VJ650_02215 [Gemmatimonadaceae bacterium]|nr:hypothetical protein [Gemmatimonadaceae bacterium]
MRRSLVLRTNPTVRQTQKILSQLDRALRERGATTDRAPAGELVFRMPLPWELARVGWLALITRGTATLSAWGGGPWRVSYRLYFGALQILTGLITLGMVIFGFGWPRLALLSAVLALWIVGYGALHLLAAHQFRDLLRDVMADVIERRSSSRTDQPAVQPSAPSASQHPE